jgi:hypothetical protein
MAIPAQAVPSLGILLDSAPPRRPLTYFLFFRVAPALFVRVPTPVVLKGGFWAL